MFLSLACFLFCYTARADFRNEEDKKIVSDVLGRFAKECPLRVATDNEIIKRLEIEVNEVRSSKNFEVQKCYENNYSQVIGVYHLYKKLCDDVGIQSINLTSSQMARQLVDISKYQGGIRTFHSLLNDCLIKIPDKLGKKYFVPLAGNELDTQELLRQIEEAHVKLPFPSTVEPYR
ncbi:MAG: hypothetical protein IPM57_08960 [Oligoflexia bacterium]|nr:hypothetical protein [Oligoflexia bacterium]